MGVPLFQIRDLIKRHNVEVFSSNYTLYQDMSNRVMATIKTFPHEVEVYSIDESFLKIRNFLPKDLVLHGCDIKDKISQWTGIPVSIGFGSTKTLAKLANHLAKNIGEYNGVCDLSYAPTTKIQSILSKLRISDIWGFGKRVEEKLNRIGVYSPDQLFKYTDNQLRKMLTVVGLKTIYELKGISCIELEEIEEAKKNMCVSRSFGKNVHSKEHLLEALTYFISKGCEKLRKQKQICDTFSIFIKTNRFSNESYYSNGYLIEMPIATNDTRILLKYLNQALDKIFVERLKYKKAGVLFYGLQQERNNQATLFNIKDSSNPSLMKAIDKINSKYGKNTLLFMPVETSQPWQMTSDFKSPKYTTSFKELKSVR